MLGDINNGDMAYYCTKKCFNLAGSSFKEISSNLRKFYLSFKEMCEMGSENPGINVQGPVVRKVDKSLSTG